MIYQPAAFQKLTGNHQLIDCNVSLRIVASLTLYLIFTESVSIGLRAAALFYLAELTFNVKFRMITPDFDSASYKLETLLLLASWINNV